ncbi:MAG: BamA/TamA family outer membrane protein [Chitinophagaceae bacterium]
MWLYRKTFNLFLLLTGILFLYSCGVKNYPKETPFVYQNKIDVVNTELKGEELSILKTRLTTQLADSMQTIVKERFVFFKQLNNPPQFDTLAAIQSASNMDIYLKTVGFYNGKASFTYKIDTVQTGRNKETQYRTTTHFTVNTGPVFRIDSINYFISDTSLQKITDQNRNNSTIRKGMPFKEETILSEIDRLIELYRNNGYYKISREQLYVDVDTVYVPLLNPLLDPFERIQILQEAQKRREHPLINVFIRTKPLDKIDTTSLQVFKIGTVNVFPDYAGDANDTTKYKKEMRRGLTIHSRSDMFRPAYLSSHIFIRPGRIYKLNDLNRTLDELNGLGTWQFIKVEPKENRTGVKSPLDTPKIDFNFLLIPAKKYSFTADLESVFNQVQTVSAGTAGNLIGLGLNLGLRNRNFDRQGIQSTNTIRGGIEAGVGLFNKGLQATELTYSNSFTLPKLLFLKKRWATRMPAKKTFITNTISSINRNVNGNGLFSLTNVGSTFGWQIRNRKNELITFQPLNVEYVRLYNISNSFKQQLDTTPFLRYSFTPGLVIGTVFNYSKPQIISKKRPNHISSFRFGVEESGAIFGRLKRVAPIFDKELFEYVKAEVEFKHQINHLKSAWVFRAIAGAGYLYDDDSTNMPFFKQFTGGGPNSMRAWPLRSIGPGASPMEQRSGRNQFFSRSGDMMFEANVEYRYNIATIWPNTLVLRGALFTDIGNVWNMRNKSNIGNDTVVFTFKNFYRDLGVSAGTGLRIDFIGLFLLRFDFGFRVKNPALPFSNENNGWRLPKFSLANLVRNREIDRQWRYENFNFSLGINYPF